MRPNTRQAERGQVLAIFALALVAIIAMTGLVLDGGSTFVQRRDQQNVADSAAMAAAYNYVNNADSGFAQAAAQANASANGYANGSSGATVSVSIADGPAGSKDITVSVTRPHANHFAGIVGMSSWNVTTTATARSGPANGAVGAAPIIFNEDAFPGGLPVGTEQAYDEPGSGNQDVPHGPSQFNWTIYCTANGNPCNANTNGVRDLIDGTNGNGATIVKGKTQIGPLNAGSHTALFDAMASLVGECFPVSVVDNHGTFQGLATFCLTGSVGGSTKQIRGYFKTPSEGDELRIVPGATPGSTAFGQYVVQLIN